MNLRIKFFFLLLFIFFGLVAVKLFYWQVLSADSLGALAQNQSQTSLTVPASRGRIFASDGSPMVLNKKAYGVYIEPKKITDLSKVESVLSEALNIPISTISASLDNKSLVWVPIAHKVDEGPVESIKKFDLNGVDFLSEQKRYYPEGSMSAHLLGFVGKDANGKDKGYFGLEGYYDEQLRGRDGMIVQDQDAQGNPILSGERQVIPAQDGRDLTLYLDKTIQFIAQTKLKEGIELYGAKGGSVIIMDPNTGGILAMSSYPSYGPADFYNYPTQYYKNPAVASFYEPGSTFKVLVMSAAINEGKLTADTLYDESGPVEIGGYTINTWNRQYHGKITMTQILEYSSNVGMVFVEEQLDKMVFLNYLKNLGIGSTTGIDLQEESSPDLRPADKWYPIDFATASFGQGVAVTPLQMVTAVSAIANGGRLMEPHVVKNISTDEGSQIEIAPKVVRTVFSKMTTDVVKEMMVEAVDKGETKNLKPAGFRIAGKTGTAQVPISGHYDSSKTIASFVGFAPVDNPKFVMLVVLDEPTASQWGSETAAPVFFSIAKQLFSYLKISPSD
ncbi:penicillin-binding protein 2 [Patescibacteria group bacterium]|nr:penicillin-binding protein 2 [Patescibacteria group bacterium]MCL5798489.1 penicillin-binding protein 2 [Patescibacteria group bacterium]